MRDLMKLQNGSDIRGVAMGNNITLSVQDIKKIAAAFGIWLKDRLRKDEITVCIGRDSRLSGEELSEGVMAGLYQIGAKIYNFNIASTPSMYMAILDENLGCDGAIMLTASHLPKDRNGMKFFTKDGGTDKVHVHDILGIAQNLELGDDLYFTAVDNDFLSTYSKNLVELIRAKTRSKTPFTGTKIIVDAGNGAGGFFASKILVPLGADISGSVFLEPDGNFPNHIPNPELSDVMEGFTKTVLKEKADLGIIFDTDVDRAAVVDGNGMEISRNRLVALMAAIVIEENPGTTIVTDSITSTGLTEFIESLGGKHLRFKRGYKNVINESQRLNQDGTSSALAIETSGHGALAENYFLDDGAYMIVKILIKFAKLKRKNNKISDLIKDLKEPEFSGEMRVEITDDDFMRYGKQVLLDFSSLCQITDGITLEKPNYEGVRVNFSPEKGNGWCLLRLSLHDPVLPINYESDSDGGQIKAFISDFLKKYDKLVFES